MTGYVWIHSASMSGDTFTTLNTRTTTNPISTVRDGVPMTSGIVLSRTLPSVSDLVIDDATYHVEMTTELVNGRYRVRRMDVTTDDGDVSATLLRKIPVSVILARSAEHGILRWQASGDDSISYSPVSIMDFDDEVQRAAVMYQLSFAVGARPAKAVSDVLGIPYATAKKRISQARERGLLGQTTSGRAGA